MIHSLAVCYFALTFSALAHVVQSQAVQASPDQNVYSLASFDQNQATELTPACNDVYTAVIPGCSAPDFLPTNACSASCIDGLTNIQTEAQAACADNIPPPNSMLMFFTNGDGVEEMCTVQKSLATNPQSPVAAQTTLVTSVVSPATTVQYSPPSATSTISTAQLASQVGAGQTNTALSQGAIIGIVVAVVVAVALMAVVLSCVRWKKYSDD
jgi:hypothetical protein